MVRLRYVAATAFVATGLLCAATLHQTESIPVLILIAPGWVVQAWLFKSDRALGGLGYQATIVGVSALFWTLLVVGSAVTIRRVVRRARDGRAA
jgi:hypothetical protein